MAVVCKSAAVGNVGEGTPAADNELERLSDLDDLSVLAYGDPVSRAEAPREVDRVNVGFSSKGRD